MKSRRIVPITILGVLALCSTFAASAQTAAVPSGTVGNSPAPAFTPGFSDLMMMLVQPRHVKLYYAGTRKNWELAAVEVNGLRKAFDRTAHAIPNYQGMDVSKTLESIMTPALKAMDAAIGAADSKQFTKSYEEMTGACNACHVYMERSFIVVKVPDSSDKGLFPGQEFNPDF